LCALTLLLALHTLLSFFLRLRPPPRPTLFPYTTLFRSVPARGAAPGAARVEPRVRGAAGRRVRPQSDSDESGRFSTRRRGQMDRSEEHTSELQSLAYLVCRLLLEKKKNTKRIYYVDTEV